MSENFPQSRPNSHSINNPNSPSFDLPPVRSQNLNNSFQNHRRLPPLTKQQLRAMILRIQYGVGGSATLMNFKQDVQGTGESKQSTPLIHRQSLSQLSNSQAQMLLQQQPRRKASLDQGLQFNPSNSSDLGLKSFATGMINTFEANQQTRDNGQLPHGQHMNSQIRQQHQQVLMQNLLLSSQLKGQPLQRGSSLSSINPQFSGLTQSGPPTTIQDAFRPQPWMTQMQSVFSSNNIQQQQQVFLPQQSSSSQIPLQKSPRLTQQQLAQLLQRQGLLRSQYQHQSSQYQDIQHMQMMQQFQHKQQESPRVQASTRHQNITSLGGYQPATHVSVGKNTNGGGNSIQGANASIQLLGKRKIQDLVSQVDPHGKLDPAVEDLLLEIADDFIDSVTTFACNLAKHRKSSTLEAKDILLHLEKNLQLKIPGYTKDGQTFQSGFLPRNVHTEKLDSIRSLMESQHFERSSGIQNFPTDSSLLQPLRPSPSSEQLILSAGAPQMSQKAQRF